MDLTMKIVSGLGAAAGSWLGWRFLQTLRVERVPCSACEKAESSELARYLAVGIGGMIGGVTASALLRQLR